MSSIGIPSTLKEVWNKPGCERTYTQYLGESMTSLYLEIPTGNRYFLNPLHLTKVIKLYNKVTVEKSYKIK